MRQALFARVLGAAVRSVCAAPVETPLPLSQEVMRTLLAHAEELRVDALVARGLVALGADPHAVDAGGRARRAAARAMLFEAAARDISRALEAAGVVHVFFKGVAVDRELYGGTGLRGASDIDVLVSDCDAALRALAAFGAGTAQELARPHLLHQKVTRTVRIHHGGRDLAVDVHASWLLAPPFVDETPAVLARRVRGDDGMWRATPEDALAYWAGNLAQDRFSGLHKASADAAAFVLRGQLDVDTLCARARAWRVAGALWLLLEHVDGQLQVPVPWRARLGPSRARRRLLQRLSRGDLPGALVRPLATDDGSAGARYLLTSLPRALRTAVAMRLER